MHDTTGANLKRVPDSSESDDKNADSDKGSDDSDDGNMSTDDDDTLAAQPGAARARAILNAEVRMLHLKCILIIIDAKRCQRPTFKSRAATFKDDSDNDELVGGVKARNTTENMSGGPPPVAKAATRKPLTDIEVPGGQLPSRRQEKHNLEVCAFLFHLFTVSIQSLYV